MKKTLLSFVCAVASVCFANGAIQQVDKANLLAMRTEIIDELKTQKQEFSMLVTPFNEAHCLPIKVMTELINNENVQLYLKSMSDYVFYLMINEKKSIKDAIAEAIRQESEESKEAYKAFGLLSNKYLEDNELLQAHVYLLVVYLDFMFGAVMLNNVLQQIDSIQ